MRKLIALIAVVLVAGFFFCSNVISVNAQKKSTKKNTKPAPLPAPQLSAEIESLAVENSLIYMVCPGVKSYSGVCPKDTPGVNVKATVKGSITPDLQVYFAVSGGKVVGNGTDIFWDLSSKRQGKYTISAGVGKNGIITGSVLTKEITLQECECDPPCECLILGLSGPSTAKRGDVVVFTASVPEAHADKNFIWDVSGGSLIVGQGTFKIFVKVSENFNGSNITATLQVEGGNLCMGECPSETATVLIEGVKSGKP